MSEKDNCEHRKGYTGVVFMTDPKIYQWRCRLCGIFGGDHEIDTTVNVLERVDEEPTVKEQPPSQLTVEGVVTEHEFFVGHDGDEQMEYYSVDGGENGVEDVIRAFLGKRIRITVEVLDEEERDHDAT